MDVLSIQVLQGFGIRAKRIVKEKSYYICNTDKGLRVIRKSFDTCEKVIFQHEIKEHLYNAGFTRIDRFYLSLVNKPYVEFDDNTYVMTDLYDYRESDFGNNRDFEKIIMTVSKMHHLSSNIKFSRPVFYGHEHLIRDYKKNVDDLSVIKKKVGSQKRLSDFDVIFLKNYDFYMNQIKTSIQLLEKTKLSQFMAEAKQHNYICHNLLKEENILHDRNDIYITGFSLAAVDSRIFDLCDIIQRYIKNMPQKHMSIYEILDIYSKYNAIQKDEIDILYPILKYPHKFIRICNQYYSKKRTWTPNAMTNRMETIVGNRDTYDAYINTLIRIT